MGYTGIPHFTNEFIALDRHTCDGHARVSQRNPMTGIERKVGPGLVCSKAATDQTWSGWAKYLNFFKMANMVATLAYELGTFSCIFVHICALEFLVQSL